MKTHQVGSSRVAVRFVQRLSGAVLCFAAALFLLSRHPSVSAVPDGVAFGVGALGALCLGYALRLFGAAGGRTLIVATLVLLLCALFAPLDGSLLRSPDDVRVFLYLVSAVADACGLWLVYRGTERAGMPAEAAPAASDTVALDTLLRAESQTPRHN